MNDWTHNYLQDMRARQDENQAANHFRGCNIAANGTFYNVVQAIFYIIVFHCDALIGHSKGERRRLLYSSKSFSLLPFQR